MADKLNINVDGLDNVIDKFDNYTRNTIQEIANEINIGGLKIQGTAKRNCPVDTGRLRASIYLNPASINNLVAKIYSNVNYGPYVEDRVNFLEDAFEEHIDNIISNLEEKLGDF